MGWGKAEPRVSPCQRGEKESPDRVCWKLVMRAGKASTDLKLIHILSGQAKEKEGPTPEKNTAVCGLKSGIVLPRQLCSLYLSKPGSSPSAPVSLRGRGSLPGREQSTPDFSGEGKYSTRNHTLTGRKSSFSSVSNTSWI